MEIQKGSREHFTQIMKRAQEGGASEEQMTALVNKFKEKYKSNKPQENTPEVSPVSNNQELKKEEAKENMGLESPLAQNQSSSDGKEVSNTSSPKGLGAEHLNQINNLKGIRDLGSTYKDSKTGQSRNYNPKTESVKVNPVTGETTVEKKEDLGVKDFLKDSVNKNRRNVTTKNIERDLVDDKLETFLIEKGIDTEKIGKAIQTAELLGEELSPEDIVTKAGIDVKEFSDYIGKSVKEKVTENSLFPYAEDENIPTSFVRGQGTSLPSFSAKSGETTEFNTEEKLQQAINADKYGFNAKDVQNFIIKKNPRLGEALAVDMEAKLDETAYENLLNNTMQNYTQDRLNFLVKKRKQIESLGYEGDSEEDRLKYKATYDEINKEIDKVQESYKEFVKNELPNLGAEMEKKQEKTAEDYIKFKEGRKGMFNGIGKFIGKVSSGAFNSIEDLALFAADQVTSEDFTEKWRINRDLDKMLDADNLLYAYESGKKVQHKGVNYLVTPEGRIIDQDAKKDVSSILDKIGLNAQTMHEKAAESKEEDYSFSLGNSTYMTGEVLGGLAVQIIGTKGLGTVLGSTARANMLGGMATGAAVSHASSFENTYQAFREHGLSRGEAQRLSSEVATTVALTTALTSTVAYNPKALQIFNSKKNMDKFVTNLIAIEKEGGKKAVSKYAKDFTVKSILGTTKEGGEEVLQENLEYFSEQFAKQTANTAYGESVLEDGIDAKSIIENTILSFASAGAMASAGELKGRSNVSDKVELYNTLSQNYDGFEKSVNRMLAGDLVTTDQANTLLKEVDNYRKYANKIPAEVPVSNLFEAIELVAQREELELSKKQTDKAFHPELDSKIESLNEQIKEQVNEKPNIEQETSEEVAEPNGVVESTEAIAQEGETTNKQEEIVENTESVNPVSDTKVEEVSNIETSEPQISEETVKVVDDISKVDLSESLGINKVNDFLDDLDKKLKKFGNENLGVNLPVVVARGALTAMRGAVKTSKVGADVISAGVNFVRGTDWYKNLSEADKKAVEQRGIIQSLVDKDATNESKIAQQVIKKETKGEDKTVKQKTREGTGLADTSRKVVTTEAKLLQLRFQQLERGVRLGQSDLSKLKRETAKAVKAAIKPFKKVMNSDHIAVAMNLIRDVNFRNIDQLQKEIDKLIDRLENREVDALVSTIPSLQKKARKKAQSVYGNRGENVRKLAAIAPEDIPTHFLNDYIDILTKLAKDDPSLNMDEANTLYELIQKDIEDSVARKNEEKANKEPKEEEDTLMDSTDFVLLAPKVKPLPDSTKREKEIIHAIKNMPVEFIRTLKASEIRKINKALNSLITGNYFHNKVLNNLVMKYEAYQVSQEIEGKVGETLLRPAGGINNFINGLKKKDFISNDFYTRFSEVMLQHIDTAVKGLKGTLFYDRVIHPITSSFEKANAKTLKTEMALSSLVIKALASTKKNAFAFNIQLQFYFRQREFENNPLEVGKKVFALEDHIQAMKDERNNLDISEATFQEVLKEYENAPKTAQEMYDNFTDEEKAVIMFMDIELAKAEQGSRDTNNQMRGKTLVYTNTYFPRSNAYAASQENKTKDIKDLSKGIGSSNVKQDASNDRKATKANPLRFNTTSIFMNHIKQANIESELALPVKQIGMILSNLRESDNKSLVDTANALDKSIKDLIEAQAGGNAYGLSSSQDALFKSLVKKSFSRMLIDPIRLSFDAASNYIPVYIMYADKLPAMIKYDKLLDKDFIKIFSEDISSVQLNRIGGARSADLKDAHTTTLNKAKFNKAKPSVKEKALDTFNKNKLTDFSDYANEWYYKFADKPAEHIWKTYLMENFERIYGAKLDTERYKNDSDYRMDVKKALQEATSRADKRASNLFNTGSNTEQKIKVQATKSNFLTRMNSFMRSFTFNENRVFWDSFHGMFGTGPSTYESRVDAFRDFAIVNSRSIAYSWAAQMSIVLLGGALGFGEEDDEEANEIAIRRALGQHAALALVGNQGAVVEMITGFAIERANKMWTESQGEKYDPFKDSVMYTVPERGPIDQYFGSLGAEGYTIMALYDFADMASKYFQKVVIEGEEVSREDFIKFKTAQISLSMLSQSTGLPVERFGKLIQKSLNAEQKEADADKALQRANFKKRYPDREVPEYLK